MKQNPGHLHGFCVLNMYCGLNIICDDSIEFAELVVKVDPFCGVLRIEWPVIILVVFWLPKSMMIIWPFSDSRSFLLLYLILEDYAYTYE